MLYFVVDAVILMLMDKSSQICGIS